MNCELCEQAVKIILENILTPVIYMQEDENGVDFICFCDLRIETEVISSVEKTLSELLDIPVSVLDIREFPEADKFEIITEAEVVYSESLFIENFIALCAASDFHQFSVDRDEALKRYHEYGTAYMQ